MRDHDVIVCGAGPAGCCAARHLSRRGFRTLLLEKETLPRPKSCGGGLTRRALEALDADLEPGGRGEAVVERRMVGARCRIDDDRWTDAAGPEPVVTMTMRGALDARLARLATDAGARLVEGTRLRGVEETVDRVTLRTDGGTFRAAYLVGADGANSRVARCLGLDRRTTLHPTLDAELHPPGGKIDARYSDMALYDLGAIVGGYAWAFPKRRSYSIGISSLYRPGADLRGGLRRFIARHPALRACRIDGPRGWFIPSVRDTSRLTSIRTLLVGDVAGCVDPFTGEGIACAAESGALAARFLARRLNEGAGPGLEPFRSLLEREIFADLRVARLLGRLFYRFRSFSFRYILGNDRAVRKFTRLMAGEIGYRALLKRILVRIVTGS